MRAGLGYNFRIWQLLADFGLGQEFGFLDRPVME